MEEGETPIQALRRELGEELAITFDERDTNEFGIFYAPAIGSEENILRMDVFVVEEWRGEPTPNSEVEEIAWVGSDTLGTMKVGSIFEHEVIPRLKHMGILG